MAQAVRSSSKLQVTERKHDPNGWRREGRDLMRAVAGGTIVGMPLLYTMEMWWHGITLSSWHLLGILAGTLLVNFFLSLVSGFRRGSSISSAVSETLTSVGIGLVLAAVILWLIGELSEDLGRAALLNKIVVEAAPVSIGVSIANSQFLGHSRTGDEEQDEGASEEQSDPEQRQLRADLKDAGATLAGATVFALNIAPTEEVIQIASRLGPWQQLILLGGAFVACYIILFASGFEKNEMYVRSPFQHPLAETLMVCVLSLAVALTLVLLLGQRAALDHPSLLVAMVLTLGFPSVVGGAAGRLIV